MTSIDPSLARYRVLRQNVERLPADRDGMRMNLQHRNVPEFDGVIPPSARIDSDPSTHDIINLSTESNKSGHKYENFVEMPPTTTFWGRPKTNQHLVHISRRVHHTASGAGLSDIVLRTVDMVTGEPISELKGEAALKAGRKLEGEIPFRLHLRKD